MDIATNAILVNLSISAWSAARQDKKVSAAIEEQAGAKKGSGVYRKFLIDPDAPLLKRIKQADGEIRAYHARMTLPWLDDGTRMLSVEAYFEYQEMLSRLKSERELLVAQFIADYPRLKGQAMADLNGLFDDREYPSNEEITRKFDVRVRLVPLPSGNDLRLNVGAEEQAKVRAEIEREVNAAVSNAVLDIFNRLHECIVDMGQRLSAYTVLPSDKPGKQGKVEKAFRDSVVENLRSLVGIIPKLNVTRDQRITAMVHTIEASLLKYSADDLRDDFMKRAEVVDSAAKFEAALAMMRGDA